MRGMKNIANWCESSFRSHAAQISIHAPNAASVAGRTYGGRAALTGAIAAARAAKQRAKRKPAAFLASIFWFLGMVFGQVAFGQAADQTDVPADFPKQCNKFCQPVFQAYQQNVADSSGKRSYPSFYGCRAIWKDYGPAWYARPDNSYTVDQFLRGRDTEPQELLTEFEKRYNGLRAQLNQCIAEHITGRKSASRVNSSGQSVATQTTPNPGQTQESQQRARDAQARADAQRQAQSQRTQSQSQESQQRAREQQALQEQAEAQRKRSEQTQARADAEAQRRGKRMHDPAAQAHECLAADFKPIVGGFKNTCGYAISYGYCVENPKKGVLTDHALFNCARMKQGFSGGGLISANSYDANHTRGGTGVQFFACRQPAYATDLTYVRGKGLEGRCVYL